MARLSGQLGSSTATDAVAALRATVDAVDPPDGLHTYVTGPGPSLVDEFDALDAQLARITVLTVGMIAALLLFVYRSPIAAAVPWPRWGCRWLLRVPSSHCWASTV